MMELSPPELYWFAGLLLMRVAPVALALSFVCWLARWLRPSALCLVVSVVAALVGIVAFTNPFCVAGRVVSDGTCAEE